MSRLTHSRTIALLLTAVALGLPVVFSVGAIGASEDPNALTTGPAPAHILVIDLNALRGQPFAKTPHWADVTDAFIKGLGVRESNDCSLSDYCDQWTQVSIVPRRTDLNGTQLPDDLSAKSPRPGVDASYAGFSPSPTPISKILTSGDYSPDIIIFAGVDGREFDFRTTNGYAPSGKLSSLALQALQDEGASPNFFLHPRLVVLLSPAQLPKGSEERVADPDRVLHDVVSGLLPDSTAAERLESALRNLSRRVSGAVWNEIFPNAAILGFSGEGPLGTTADAMRSLENSLGARLSSFAYSLAKPEQRDAPGNTIFFQELAKDWEAEMPGAKALLPLQTSRRSSLPGRGAANLLARERLLLDLLGILSGHAPTPWSEALPLPKRAQLFGKVAHIAVQGHLDSTAKAEAFLRLIDLYASPGFDASAESALHAESNRELFPTESQNLLSAVQKLLSSRDIVPFRFALSMIAIWDSHRDGATDPLLSLVDSLMPLLEDDREEVRVAVFGLMGQFLYNFSGAALAPDAEAREEKALELIAKIGLLLKNPEAHNRNEAIQCLARLAERGEGENDHAPAAPLDYLKRARALVCTVAVDAVPLLKPTDRGISDLENLIDNFSCPADAAEFERSFDLLKAIQSGSGSTQAGDAPNYCDDGDRPIIGAAGIVENFAGGDASRLDRVEQWLKVVSWSDAHRCDADEIGAFFAKGAQAP